MNKIKNPMASYENKWVALSSDKKKVVAAGSSIKQLEKKLEGFKQEEVILTFVPPFDKVLSLQC